MRLTGIWHISRGISDKAMFHALKKERAAAGNADSSEKREIYQNSVNRLK